MKTRNFTIRIATIADVPIILELIRALATYERAPNEVTATEEQLVDVLFGEKPAAEVLLAFEAGAPVGFAVYFYNFSTWLAAQDSTSKTCSLGRRIAAKVMVAPYSFISRKLRTIAVVAGWSGRCWIGTSRRSIFIKSSAPDRSMIGQCSV